MPRATKAELEAALEQRDQVLEELRSTIDRVLGYEDNEVDEEAEDEEEET